MRGVVWLGSAVAAGLIVAAAVIGLRGSPPRRPASAPAADAARHAPGVPAKAAPVAVAVRPAPPAPSFDVVTVDPHGHAVIAGRAAPGERVRVLANGKLIGEVTADARGEWVLVPKAPLELGNRQLALEAVGPGGTVRRSDTVVALSVTRSASADRKLSTLAVLLPEKPGAPVRVLQRPAPAPAGQKALSLETASWGAGGRLELSGHAKPGARLNVYAGDRLLGTATADGGGNWSLAANEPRSPGGVELRLDQFAASGAVAARVAAPLAQPTAAATPGGTYVVERGNSLWLIARHFYGKGTRYTVIYSANRKEIRNPNLIYPGQRFKLPKS